LVSPTLAAARRVLLSLPCAGPKDVGRERLGGDRQRAIPGKGPTGLSGTRFAHGQRRLRPGQTVGPRRGGLHGALNLDTPALEGGTIRVVRDPDRVTKDDAEVRERQIDGEPAPGVEHLVA
jgi:hypothetical protein